MNAANRKKLRAILDQLEDLKEELTEVLDDEEEKRDNTPDNLLGSEQYEKREEVCSNLSDATGTLEDVISSIEAAIE